MTCCRVEWPYGAHGESLREACGSGRRCSPRSPPVKPSTIPCSPDLVPSVGPSGATWGSRLRLCKSATLDFNYPVRLRSITSQSRVAGCTGAIHLLLLSHSSDVRTTDTGRSCQPCVRRSEAVSGINWIVIQREDGSTTGPRPVVAIDSGPGRPLNHTVSARSQLF